MSDDDNYRSPKALTKTLITLGEASAKHPTVAEFITYFAQVAATTPHLNDMELATLQYLSADCFFAAHWRKSAYSAFEVTESLAAALLLTESITSFEGMNFPHHAFMMYLPRSLLGIYETVTVHRSRPEKSEEDAAVLEPVEEQTSADFIHIGLHASDGQSKYMRCRCDIDLEDKIDSGEFVADVAMLPENSKRLFFLTVRLIKNLVAWIHANQQSLGSPKKQSVLYRWASKKKKRSLQKGPMVWVIGKEVILEPRLLEHAKLHIRGEAGPAWKLGVRHIVRGHFKQQACGPGRMERVTKWIEPYWRGEDLETAVSHLYKANQP